MNTRRSHTNHCRTLRTILRVACFIALAALLSVNCRTIIAQEQPSKPSSKPQLPAEARKASPTNADDLQSAEIRTKQILALKDKLLQLTTDGSSSESSKAEMGFLTEALAKAAFSAQSKQSGENSPEQRALQFLQMGQSMEKNPEQRAQAQQLQLMKEQLVEREKQMATLLAEQRRQPLPPLENGQLKVFSLVAVPARAAAQTIDSLFGSQVLRIAVDERSNSLIVYGKSDSLSAVEALLSRLDQQAAATPGGEKSKQSAAAAPRSLLLRVFWLADNLPEGVGQKPADFLPDSVIQAAKKLGVVEAPRLVTQTVNSLALGREDAADFSTSVPAILFDQPVDLTCQGKIKLVSDDRVRLDMGVHVGGPEVNCEINGSLATPLGHYMVLGTANSVMAEGKAATVDMGRGPGIVAGGPEGGAFRPGGPGLRAVKPNQVPGGFGAARGAPGAVAGPGGEFGPAPGEQGAKQNFNTSRFAFVVQVIDGQSYPAEKEKADRMQLPPSPK